MPSFFRYVQRRMLCISLNMNLGVVFLTGAQGQRPEPFWDPLTFMIEECHRRGMELHAWINPYRAKTKNTQTLAHHHPSKLYPERFIAYEGQLFFDPGQPKNREYICMIVTDIVKNYDVDAIHMDDYFYPYPSGGADFPDEETFQNNPRGFTSKADWRRGNTEHLLQILRKAIVFLSQDQHQQHNT